jgi:hypothetical protein
MYNAEDGTLMMTPHFETCAGWSFPGSEATFSVGHPAFYYLGDWSTGQQS